MTPAPTEPAKADKLRILVVDDDPIFRQLAISKLVRFSAEVVEAGDGASAWAKLAHEPFQLALVDLEMPHLKGDELIRCIRGHPRTRHLPVIVITSRNDADAVRESLDAGATSFLTKPVNWSMFGNHIEYLLKLNRVAEKGIRAQEEARQTTEALRILVSEVASEFASSADRIASLALAVQETAKNTAAAEQVATAIKTLVRETETARTSLVKATAALESGLEATGPAPASGANKAEMLRAS